MLEDFGGGIWSRVSGKHPVLGAHAFCEIVHETPHNAESGRMLIWKFGGGIPYKVWGVYHAVIPSLGGGESYFYDSGRVIDFPDNFGGKICL